MPSKPLPTKPSTESSLLTPPRSRWGKVEWTIALVCAAATVCWVAILVLGLRPDSGQGVTPDKCPFVRLPENAANVDYYWIPLGPWRYAQFDVPYNSFDVWRRAVQREGSQGPVTGSMQVHIYNFDTQGGDDIKITNGEAYHWNKEDQGLHLTYDHDTGRAYYFEHTR